MFDQLQIVLVQLLLFHRLLDKVDGLLGLLMQVVDQLEAGADAVLGDGTPLRNYLLNLGVKMLLLGVVGVFLLGVFNLVSRAFSCVSMGTKG